MILFRAGVSGIATITDSSTAMSNAAWIVVVTALVAITKLYAYPGDIAASMIICGPLAWTCAVSLPEVRGIPILRYLPVIVQINMLAMAIVLSGENHSEVLHDVRFGGRAIDCCGTLFLLNAGNRQLAESYIGAQAGVVDRRRRNFEGIDALDLLGADSLTASDLFPHAISSLPDNDARRQVLRCLCDHKNLLRYHQGMLLSCIAMLGPPSPLDMKEWWSEHRWLFVVDTDRLTAAPKVWGWCDRIRNLGLQPEYSLKIPREQLHAANFFEELQLSYYELDTGGTSLMRPRQDIHVEPADCWVHRIRWWNQR